jgi:tetratricopeptide (TPR) repeat protein
LVEPIDVFISYARADQDWVTTLADNLTREGFRIFYDRYEIAPGDRVVMQLDNALRQAKGAVIVVGSTTLSRPWVQTEYSVLVERASAGELRLIPVLIDEAELPPMLGTFGYLDFRDARDQPAYRKLFQELASGLRNERPAHPTPGSGGISYPGEVRGRPSQVTLRIDRDVVMVESAGDMVRQRHGGVSHRIREAQWLVDRLRRRGQGTIRAAGSTAPGARGLPDPLLRLGRALGESFLGGSAGAAIAAELASADRENVPLRLCVEVVDDPELEALAWETVTLPRSAEPLALHPRLQLYRSVPGLGPVPTISIPGPLRILAVIASPEHATGELLDTEAELNRIVEAVDPARRHERAHVRILNWGSVERIRSALLQERFHVLHICCHAEAGRLILETDDGRPDPVDAARFVRRILVPGSGVPLVVLAGCSTGLAARSGSGSGSGSGEPDGTGEAALPGLAQALLAHGVPAVLAMTAPVTDRYAISLAGHFYQGLADRRAAPDALAALSDARRALQVAAEAAGPGVAAVTSGVVEWPTPTLFLRGVPHPLFDPSVPFEAVDVPAPPSFSDEIAVRGVGDFVGRRAELRTLLRELRGTRPAVLIHGIGGIGKTTLARELVMSLGDDAGLLVMIRGQRTADEILQAVGLRLWTACPRMRLAQDDPLREISRILKEGTDRWQDKLELVRDGVLPRLPLLLFVDNAEQYVDDDKGGLAPTLAATGFGDFLAAWLTMPATARLLLTSRHPLPLPPQIAARITTHHLGPLSLAETSKLIWRLPALDALGPDERARVYADVGGHPRALEYIDALLGAGRANFDDIVGRMEATLRSRNIDPARLFAESAGNLDRALAEAVTLAVDEVLLDRLLVRLRSFPLARELFVAASVFREPVDSSGLNWAVADVRDRDRDSARDERLRAVYEKLRAAHQRGAADSVEDLDLAPHEFAQFQRDLAAQSRPPDRPGLHRAKGALLGFGLLSTVQVPGDGGETGTRYLVHRWTAQQLRKLTVTGDIEPEDLVGAHRRAAAYYDWRATLWPDVISDLVEARYHYWNAGDTAEAVRTTASICALLHDLGALDWEGQLCEEALQWAGRTSVEAVAFLHRLGLIAQTRGRLDDAESLERECLAVAGRHAVTGTVALCYEQLGVIAQARGRTSDAKDAYRKALDIARTVPANALVARCYQRFGALELDAGAVAGAYTWSVHALHEAEQMDRRRRVAVGSFSLGAIARARGDAESAAALSQHASASAEESVDLLRVAGDSLHQLGRVHLLRDEPETARQMVGDALDIGEILGDRLMIARCQLTMGRLHHRCGEYDHAYRCYADYLDVADELDDRPGIADCYYHLGELAQHQDDLDRAAEWNQKALAIAVSLHDQKRIAEAHARSGALSLRCGMADPAERAYRRALGIAERLDDDALTVACWLGLGEVARQRGDLDAAAGVYQRCLDLAMLSQNQIGIARCHLGDGGVAQWRGDLERAERKFDMALGIAEELGHRSLRCEALRRLGEVAQGKGDRDAAMQQYQEAQRLAEQQPPDPATVADCLRRQGNLAGTHREAMELHLSGLEILERLDNTVGAARYCLDIARLAAGHGDTDEAEHLYERALGIVHHDERRTATVEGTLGLGDCARRRRDLGKAETQYRAALTMAEALGLGGLVARCCQQLGVLCQLHPGERQGEAAVLHERALALAEAAGDREGVSRSCRDLGRLALARSAYEDAADKLTRSLQLAKSIQDRPGAASCRQQLALAARRRGDGAAAAAWQQQDPTVWGNIPPGDHELARERGRIGASLTLDGRPAEALGFTAASLAAWLNIDIGHAREQQGWLRHQYELLGGARFAAAVADYLPPEAATRLLTLDF